VARPTVELTAELLNLHERLRSEGVPIEECCRIAGHSVGVWYRWAREGERAIRERDEHCRLFRELVAAMGGWDAVNEWLVGEGEAPVPPAEQFALPRAAVAR
jgi:hypothetical protein